tara:strand:+ start:519 stop:884 length:366 start_codon:yes stop_codon:yes gene_type:complete
MNDLKIPNLNNKSKQYLFKNKIPLKRKSRLKLIKESLIMFIIAGIIISINYSIPDKNLLFNSFINNINNVIQYLIKIMANIYQLFLVVFIIFSLLFSLVLVIGGFYRIYKIFRRKSKRIFF